MRKTTLQDIADRAGVSRATVDRALHGRGRVMEETRQNILRIAGELNHSPNLRARGLKLSRSFLIGMAVPNISKSFYADVVQGTEECLKDYGYGLILCNIVTRQSADRYLSMLRTQGVDGIISCAEIEYGWDGHLRTLAGEGTPVVMINDRVAGVDGPVVYVDQVKGGYLATKCLLDAGHRRVLFIGRSRGYINLERKKGYRQALEEAGIKPDGSLCISFDNWDEEFDAFISGLTNHQQAPTAAFIPSDLAAVKFINRLQSCGYRVPDDFSVVGFDDLSSLQWFIPGLTTIRQQKKEMGFYAAQLLLARLKGEKTEDVLLDVELVERNTVCKDKNGGTSYE
ncbi:MAG: LacI family DNA-binding transcriptional regulator [bacterium]|nr:LacI family DNA-binding transcriptional regulator [bacterium]